VRVVFDTNVVLDVLLAREPHAAIAAELFSLVETGRLEGAVCATTVTTVHYLAAKAAGDAAAKRLVATLLDVFDVAAVDRTVLEGALALALYDFEDGVVCESARAIGAVGIVTRDRKGFADAPLPVYAPAELLAAVRATQ